MDSIWQRLKNVTQMTLKAEYAGKLWTGQGRVGVHGLPSGNGLIFEESGVWHATKGKLQPFVNQYIWAFDYANEAFSLSRKRAESEVPELLARFVKDVACHTRTPFWRQETPHLCGKDCYTAELNLDPQGVSLAWTIYGPKKDDRVWVAYR